MNASAQSRRRGVYGIAHVGAVAGVDAAEAMGVFLKGMFEASGGIQSRSPVSKSGDVTSELRAVINCDETPHQALERMELIGTRHLPVVDGERGGYASMRDLMRVELASRVMKSSAARIFRLA